jgi:hypothetical protein
LFPNSLTSTQKVNVGVAGDTVTSFELPSYSSTSAVCGIQSYSLVEASSADIAFDGSTLPTKVYPTDRTIHEVYTFKVQITLDGGGTWTSELYSLDVGCTNA